jgi:hypothetical protein
VRMMKNPERLFLLVPAMIVVGALGFHILPMLKVDAPDWCAKACGASPVYDFHTPNHKFVLRCKDEAFIDEDSPKLCEKRGGVSSRTDIGSVDSNCFCEDGALFQRHEKEDPK